jgi:oxaloacetate decarboxylase (Na+ extruding) subunit alpha
VGAQHDHRHDASGLAPYGSGRLRRHGVFRQRPVQESEQKDNPWDWVRYGQKEVKNTQLRYHGGLSSGFTLTPACIPRLVIERVVHYGITLTRLSDPWNNYNELKKEVAELRNLGMESVVNLIYSVSPRHTDDYYAGKAREAAAMRPYRVCFKDVGGMLTPERTRTLVKLIRENVGDTTLEFHAHCNNGLAPFNLLEAVKEGIRIVHTSVPPLANGSAQPSIFNVARNLRALVYRFNKIYLITQTELQTFSNDALLAPG